MKEKEAKQMKKKENKQIKNTRHYKTLLFKKKISSNENNKEKFNKMLS